MSGTKVPTSNEVQANGTFSGGGEFAKVYLMPDDKAVKISAFASADGWLWWAVYSIIYAGKSDHLPVIHGLRINVRDNSFVAVLDALKEVRTGQDDDPDETHLEAFYDAEDEFDALVDGLVELVQENGGPRTLTDYDQMYNWMLDADDTAILTDPVCFHGWRAAKTSKGWTLDALIELIKRCPKTRDFVELV